MNEIDEIDLSGNLETIANLAHIGMFLMQNKKMEFMPTILEDIFEHSQRLTMEYATKEQK